MFRLDSTLSVDSSFSVLFTEDTVLRYVGISRQGTVLAAGSQGDGGFLAVLGLDGSIVLQEMIDADGELILDGACMADGGMLVWGSLRRSDGTWSVFLDLCSSLDLDSPIR
jgi:hypothetical protein